MATRPPPHNTHCAESHECEFNRCGRSCERTATNIKSIPRHLSSRTARAHQCLRNAMMTIARAVYVCMDEKPRIIISIRGCARLLCGACIYAIGTARTDGRGKVFYMYIFWDNDQWENLR